MKHRIRSFFAIPPEIRPDFWQAAYQRNRLSVLVICIMIFGMELFNMARVLFWWWGSAASSPKATMGSKLTTRVTVRRWLRLAVSWKLSITPIRKAVLPTGR